MLRGLIYRVHRSVVSATDAINDIYGYLVGFCQRLRPCRDAVRTRQRHQEAEADAPQCGRGPASDQADRLLLQGGAQLCGERRYDRLCQAAHTSAR